MKPKLYKYDQNYGRMGSIQALLFLTDDQIEIYDSAELYWYELLGKHSKGVYVFDETTLTEIKLDETVMNALIDTFGLVVCGPFDFDDFEKQIRDRFEGRNE